MPKTKAFEWAKKQDVDGRFKLYALSFETDEDYFYNNTTPDRFLWSLVKRAPQIGVPIIRDLIYEILEPETYDQQNVFGIITNLETEVTIDDYQNFEPLLTIETDIKNTYINKALISFLGFRCNVFKECKGIYDCVTSIMQYMKIIGVNEVNKSLGIWIRSKISFDDWLETFDF